MFYPWSWLMTDIEDETCRSPKMSGTLKSSKSWMTKNMTQYWKLVWPGNPTWLKKPLYSQKPPYIHPNQIDRFVALCVFFCQVLTWNLGLLSFLTSDSVASKAAFGNSGISAPYSNSYRSDCKSKEGWTGALWGMDSACANLFLVGDYIHLRPELYQSVISTKKTPFIDCVFIPFISSYNML